MVSSKEAEIILNYNNALVVNDSLYHDNEHDGSLPIDVIFE